MDVVVKEGGDATTGSSSHTMLLVGLSLVAAVAGGVAIWWFFFRKKKDDGDGGGPPKRENMKWAPGHRGIVGVLPDCKVLEGASDYAQAGRLCTISNNPAGICKKGDDGSFSCVQRTTDLGGGSAANLDACKAQCDALEAQKAGSCYFADWYQGGATEIEGACLLRPLDTSMQSSFCNWSDHQGRLWYAWAPEATNGDCPGLDQMSYASNKTVGLVDNTLSIGVELQVGDQLQCAAEAARRTAAASKDKTVFVGSYSNGKCWVFQNTDPMADCLASAPPETSERSPSGPSSYAIYNGQLQTPPTCPNPWKAVEKKGDLTCNLRLRPKMRSNVASSSLTCMTACQDPTVDGSDLTFAQPASQFFPDKSECWCYDWPALPNDPDEHRAQVVFCSDQTPENPRLSSSKLQPPVIVNTKMAQVTPASAKTDAKCQDKTYLKPTCSASYEGKEYRLDTYCSRVSPDFTEVLSILGSDENTSFGVRCNCVETDVMKNLGGPLFPAWGLPYWSERPASPDAPFTAFNGTPSSCASGVYVVCDPPIYPPSDASSDASKKVSESSNNQYCQSGPGSQPESSPCVTDADCVSNNCVCGQVWQKSPAGGEWEKKKDCSPGSAPPALQDWKGCGVCGPPPPSAK